MRKMILVLAGLVAGAAASAQAQTPAPALANAEACLKERVAEAVSASSGAADAAEFLLSYLCAEAVTASGRYRYNTAMVAAMQGVTGMFEPVADDRAEDAEEAEDSGAAEAAGFFGSMGSLSVNQTTGELVGAEGASPLLGAMGAQNLFMEALYLQPSADLRAFAGQLILEARRP